MLSLGCGGGAPVAANLAARGLRVTGVDAAPTLVALCRERLPDQEWILADMRKLALGRRFAGLLAWDSFFHLGPEDQRRMMAVFAAHAVPGAVLMLNTGPTAGEAVGCYRGDPLYHASLDTAEYGALFARHGFVVEAHAVEDQQAGGRTAWLARHV